MKRASDGELVLLEIAPRVSGSMGLYRNLGVNFALLGAYDRDEKDEEHNPAAQRNQKSHQIESGRNRRGRRRCLWSGPVRGGRGNQRWHGRLEGARHSNVSGRNGLDQPHFCERPLSAGHCIRAQPVCGSWG